MRVLVPYLRQVADYYQYLDGAHCAKHELESGDGYGVMSLYDFLTDMGVVLVENLVIGQAYFFLTGSHNFIGIVKERTFSEIVLTNAINAKQTGNLREFFGTGNVVTYEYVGEWTLQSIHVIGYRSWNHEIPA